MYNIDDQPLKSYVINQPINMLVYDLLLSIVICDFV